MLSEGSDARRPDRRLHLARSGPTFARVLIAYLHYGERSGVRQGLCPSLRTLGHHVVELEATGPLEPRVDGRLHLTAGVALHLGAAALRYGIRALEHRWNTPLAFDVHSRRAARLLAALPRRPDLVLQHGGLFSPGQPPFRPYALLLDHTRRAALEQPSHLRAGFPAPVDYGPGWDARERALYHGAGALCVHSRRVARSLSRHYGLAGASVSIVGAGANVFPERIERRDDGRTIAFVGREFVRKGGRVLARAFDRLRRARPTARLLVAGPTERLDLPEGAVQLGPIALEDLPSFFASATVFAMPTLLEPFGLAFLDAMACGLPCVGTSIDAVPEIIEDGETGLLVPPDDDVALEQALRRLLDDPCLARRMGDRGRERVGARFRWSHVARAVDRALVEATAARPAVRW